MPKFEVVYTETRTKRAIVVATDHEEAYECFHNCRESGEVVEEGEWRYHSEDTQISDMGDDEVKDAK